MNPLRRKLMFGALALLIADLALLVWLLSPQAPSRAATQQQLADARLQLVSIRAQSGQLARLSENLHTSQQQIQEIMAAGIPHEADASSKLLSEFSRLATASQVQVSGAEFHPDKKANLGLRRIAISLQVAGGYGNVVRFLNQMERSPMFFLINQVSVSGGAANANTVKLDVQLEAYARI